MTTQKNAQAGAGGNGAKGGANNAPKAGQKNANASAKSGKSTAGLAVSSHQDGYRRGGRAWTREPQRVALSELTEEQLQQLQDDKNIALVEIDLPAAEGAETGSEGGQEGGDNPPGNE